jgi:hypothetical protein
MTLTAPHPRSAAPEPWSPRSPVELLADQLAAVDAWNAARRATERDLAESGSTREGGLDARRRLSAVRRETDALRARSEHALRTSGELLRTPGRPRALLVHRQQWLRRALGTALEAAGLEVVRRTCAFSPRTVVLAQVGHEGGVPPMLDAGAHLALPRRVRPAELSRALLDAGSMR